MLTFGESERMVCRYYLHYDFRLNLKLPQITNFKKFKKANKGT